MEMSPIAVILVHMDSKGDRLLFRYPYQVHSTAITAQATPEPKKRNPYAANNTDELQTQRPPNTNTICATAKCIMGTGLGANIYNANTASTSNVHCGVGGQLQGCTDEVLSTLLAVKQQLCNQKFELKVNDVRFVSHPTHIQRRDQLQPQQRTTIVTANSGSSLTGSITAIGSGNINTPIASTTAGIPITTAATGPITLSILSSNATPPTTNKPLPQHILINVAFALHAQASYSIVKCYHELSKRIGLALKVEEHRIGYLSDETMLMVRTHDEISTQQLPVERALDLILERCSLARALKAIYHELCHTGLLSATLNQNLTLNFCLPQKAHQLHKKGTIVDPEAIDCCLRSLKPYHGVLLRGPISDLLECVPVTATRMIGQLTHAYSPLISLQCMASKAEVSLESIYKLVSHLVYWAKATIIYPLCETNVYVIAPDAPLHMKSHLIEKFTTLFPGMSLIEVIADFSLPTSIGHLTTPLQQPARKGILAQMVIWMLQHHLIMQLHTYVQFMPHDFDEMDGNPIDISMCDDTDGTENTACATANSDKLLDLSQTGISDACELGEAQANSPNFPLDPIDDEVPTMLSMPSQPLPVPQASRRSITDDHYSACDSNASDNMAVQPSSSHKSNYSVTSLSTENCDSIASMEDEEKIKELLLTFDEADRSAIRHIPASTQVDDLALMVKLYEAGYFKSEHHLEEIMYFENLRRSQLLQLLDKFRNVLIIYVTEDPAIASMYNNK